MRAPYLPPERWNDPLPPLSPPQANRNMRSSPSPTSSSWGSSPRSPSSPTSVSGSEDRSPVLPPLRRQDSISFDHLPNQSLRTLFILDRFTSNGTILYCSNDLLVTTLSAVTRSFFDFVAKRHEETVRSWIDCVKGWGVNELGQPSDGGFGFGRFTLLAQGRDSRFALHLLPLGLYRWLITDLSPQHTSPGAPTRSTKRCEESSITDEQPFYAVFWPPSVSYVSPADRRDLVRDRCGCNLFRAFRWAYGRPPKEPGSSAIGY